MKNPNGERPLAQRERERRRKEWGLTGLKVIHFLGVVALFYVFWLLFRYGRLDVRHNRPFRYVYYVTIGYGALLLFFHRVYNAYLLGYSRIRSLIFSQAVSQLFSAIIVYLGVSLAWQQWRSPMPLIWMWLAAQPLNVVWSTLCTRLYFRIYPPRRTLLIYRNAVDKRRLGSLGGKPSGQLYRITEELKYTGNSFEEIRSRLVGFEAVFVAGVSSSCRNGILKYCQEECIPGFFLPHVGDVIMQDAVHIQSFDSPVLHISRKMIRPEYAMIKRAADILVSLAGIVVLSPILAVTALAIRLYDGGPAIYRQVRLTKDEKRFEIYKFRSMRVDAEKDGVARLSTGEKDDRITPIGRVVRKCRLDELPQLFNILKGDMSLVGPRPERPEIAEQYYRKMPDFRLRLQVKAGLTGYAQVYGKYNTDPYEKLEFDLLYIHHMSVLTDLRLLFATFGILFSSESTAGVEEGALTAMDGEDEEGEP